MHEFLAYALSAPGTDDKNERLNACRLNLQGWQVEHVLTRKISAFEVKFGKAGQGVIPNVMTQRDVTCRENNYFTAARGEICRILH